MCNVHIMSIGHTLILVYINIIPYLVWYWSVWYGCPSPMRTFSKPIMLSSSTATLKIIQICQGSVQHLLSTISLHGIGMAKHTVE